MNLPQSFKINSLEELKPDCMYSIESKIIPESLPLNVSYEQISHCLQLRLLHIFGPYENECSQCKTLIAQSLNDVDYNVLICVKITEKDQYSINFDQVNQVFTLQNFLTVKCRRTLSFHSEIDCPVMSKPFFDIALVVSFDIGSIIHFHGAFCETEEHDYGNLLSEEEVYVFTDEEPEEEEDLFESDVPKIIIPKHQTQAPSLPPVSTNNLFGPLTSDESNTTKHILESIEPEIKAKFNVERFVRLNIRSTNSEVVETIPLSKIEYPGNNVQSFKFVNIVGIIKRRNQDLIICDEDIDSFLIKLVFKGIGWFKNKQNNISSLSNKLNDENTLKYPLIKCGDIVCIRDLCLTSNSINICAHPIQLTVIEAHKKDDILRIVDNKKISCEELRRVTELVCFLIEKMMVPRSILFMGTTTYDLVGMMLAKLPSNNTNLTVICLLLPERIAKPCYIDLIDFPMVLNQIENMTFHPNRHLFDENVIKKFKENNQIALVKVYDNHQNVLKTLMPLDYVSLFNVHLKEENFYKGFSHYALHGTHTYGQRILQIHPNSIWGELLEKIYETSLRKIRDSPNEDSFDNYDIDLDESVLERLGPNVQQVIRNFIPNQKEISLEAPALNALKRNLFSYIASEKALIKPKININAAKKIETFDQLLEENPTDLFRISAYLVNYQFEDKFGVEFYNIAHLRQSLLKMICSSSSCDHVEPFVSFLLPKTYDLMATDSHFDKTFFCGKCKSPMQAYLCLQLYLLDECGKHLTVLLSSPEIEDLIGLPSKQLICQDPESTSICKALHYALKTLCPIRSKRFRTMNGGCISSNSDLQSSDNSANAINLKVDWILESVKCDMNNFNFNTYSHVFNKQLFNSSSSSTITEFFLYYVRCILINE